MAHLLEGLTDRLWRAREASCAALAEAVAGRTFTEIGDTLCELHERLVRCVDDIKESVRKAALGAWRATSSVINRLCDGALAPSAQAEQVQTPPPHPTTPSHTSRLLRPSMTFVRTSQARRSPLQPSLGPSLTFHSPR